MDMLVREMAGLLRPVVGFFKFSFYRIHKILKLLYWLIDFSFYSKGYPKTLFLTGTLISKLFYSLLFSKYFFEVWFRSRGCWKRNPLEKNGVPSSPLFPSFNNKIDEFPFQKSCSAEEITFFETFGETFFFWFRWSLKKWIKKLKLRNLGMRIRMNLVERFNLFKWDWPKYSGKQYKTKVKLHWKKYLICQLSPHKHQHSREKSWLGHYGRSCLLVLIACPPLRRLHHFLEDHLLLGRLELQGSQWCLLLEHLQALVSLFSHLSRQVVSKQEKIKTKSVPSKGFL